MTPNNSQVFLSSMARLDKRLKYYGEGDVSEITLLKMIYKYACYSASYECLQALDKMVMLLQQMDNDICMDFLPGTSFFPEDNGGDPGNTGTDNTAPVIDNASITVTGQTYTTFVIGDFTGGWTDTEGDSWGNIVIKTLPANGTLTFNGVDVVVGQEITPATIGNLIYTRNADTGYSTSFNWAVYDDNQSPLQSNTATMTVTVNALSTTTIGDNTIYVDNRAETVFTLAMFTTELVAPYNDPEGDLIDAIRIDDISGDNLGVFYLSGVPLDVGDIITREQINAGNFTHTGPDQDTINSDVFEFSARDEGSGIWVN